MTTENTVGKVDQVVLITIIAIKIAITLKRLNTIIEIVGKGRYTFY